MSRPSVFISYNWGSDAIVDDLESRIKEIANVYRDKNSIKPWQSITDFMKQIRETDLVVVVLSDKYLKSIACLYEVMQLIKDDNWVSHSMFLVEESAQGIYNIHGQLEYVKYWESERVKLETELKGINPALVTSQADDLKKIQLIQLHLNEFMKHVADRNNPEVERALYEVAKRVQSNGRETESDTEDD